MKGKLTISVDLELAWGVWDELTPERLRLAEDAERPICAALIELFDRHAIRATWAMVAALLDEKSSEARPGAKGCWYAPDIVERLLAAKTQHEIGSHGGHHVYYDEIDAASAGEDLAFARNIHRRSDLPFVSMVFPRNTIGHLPELEKAGLRVFRGPDAGPVTTLRKAVRPLGQAANLADKLLPFPPPLVHAARRGAMIEVPGSMLLIGRNGLRRFVLPTVTRAKLERGLARARSHGGVFHVWFHPSNFYYRRDEQLDTLDWFLERAADEAARGHIDVLTMGAYADSQSTERSSPAMAS
ncbi:MAG: hypothetical protein ACRECX_09245 [Methyloceanibacter sp.]|uniref:hypothetical protein n=1 Tax=Methyloceanibacter sp. TaxID=1965321 RepID=UPI003D6D112F